MILIAAGKPFEVLQGKLVVARITVAPLVDEPADMLAGIVRETM